MFITLLIYVITLLVIVAGGFTLAGLMLLIEKLIDPLLTY